MYKHIILWVYLLLIGCAVACKKNDDNTATFCSSQNDASCANDTNMPVYYPGDTTHGIIRACRNGDEWTASGWAKRYSIDNSKFYISGETFGEEGVLRGDFYLVGIPLKKGVFGIDGDKSAFYDLGDPYGSFHTSTSDGDVAEDSYQLVYSPESWVEITHLDTINNKVAGKFEVYLAVEQPKECLQNLDNLCFKSGTFEVDIIE